MDSVELLFEKSFSGADRIIVDRFVEFQQALIEADTDRLNDIVLDDFRFTQLPGKSRSKSEFFCDMEDGSLVYLKSDIIEPTVLFDDGDSASLISKLRLTARVNGRELRWISNTVASFRRIDGVWYLAEWEN